MKKQKRSYDREFKERAVDLYFSGDQSYTEVAADLGIPTSTLAF
ncbi:MAG: transposase [Candidatus Marinimicrobia bacterium]|nr:transposase [Candidatus Neomarinimicrobiota bacterium]